MLKSPGAICEQYAKCGKATCRCNAGELHGPYHCLFYRDDLGKLKKRYVKRGDVSALRSQLAAQKATDAVMDARLREIDPPKRRRNYDPLSSLGRMAMQIDRTFGITPKQGKDAKGRFVKAARA
jgi:hypothetical protein